MPRLLALCLVLCSTLLATDPLPSWKEGPVKQALIQFVHAVSEKGSEHYIAPEARIATFDQDGTLWVEKPIYTQLIFAIDRIKAMASQHPEWNTQEPFKSILEENLAALNDLTEAEIEKIVAVTHAGMTVEEFQETVRHWLKTAVHPRYKKPFTELVYQPMLEVLKFFRDHGFTNYIASGGGQEFMRVYTSEVYQIPSERVIGTAGKIKYEYRDGKPALLKLPEILYVDDKQGKLEGINLMIGKRPIAAFGNSDGDRQMLEWTQAGKGKQFELLVHHDDAVREYAYDEHSKVGTFSQSLMEEAKKQGWHVVSMRNDWLIIFPWEKKF